MNLSKTQLLKISMLSILLLLSISEKAQAVILNKVVAYVGGSAITLYDVQSLDPAGYKRIALIENEQEREKALAEYETAATEFLISQKIIEVAAKREGIIVREEEIDTALSDVAQRSGVSVDDLSELVQKEGMSMPMYRLRLKSEILNARVRMQVIIPKTIVSDDDIYVAIKENPDEYSLHDKYNVRMLMMPSKKDLQKVAKEIKKGLSFSEAVTKYSIDASAANGGAMGWIEPDLLSADMRNALVSSEIGELTNMFSVNNQSWAVFMVDDFRSKYDISDDVRDKLKAQVSESIFTRVFEQWYEKNQETIVVLRTGDIF